MSTKSSLKERVGQRVHIREIDRVPSGSPVRLSLRLGEAPNTPEAARILARRHVSLRAAHRALSHLSAGARGTVLLAPRVEDRDRLVTELAAVGIVARPHETPEVDPRTVRERTGLSQDEFALRYGLDVSTLRNWEQGRSKPDAAGRAVLWTIAYYPEAVERSIEASGGSHDF